MGDIPTEFISDEEALNEKISLRSKINKLKNLRDFDLTDDQNEQLKATLTSFACLLTEIFLSQPFITIKTQCQINIDANISHYFPYSLLNTTVNLIKSQGILCLWKGMLPTFVVYGLTITVENLISDMLQYPRDVDFYKSPNKAILQHIILKSVTYTIMAPVYAANILQNIQSYIINVEDIGLGLFSNNVMELIKDTYLISGACISSFFKSLTSLVFRSSHVNNIDNNLSKSLLFNLLPTICINKVSYHSGHKIIDTIPVSKANFLSKFLFINKWAPWTIIPIFVTYCLSHYLATRYFENLLARILTKIDKEARKKKKLMKAALQDPAYNRFDDSSISSSFDEGDKALVDNADHDFVHVRSFSPVKRRSPHCLASQNNRIMIGIMANFGARMLSDVVCYPLLTATNIILLRSIMNNVFPRRHIIIDDLDTGLRLEPLGHHYLSSDSLVLDDKLLGYSDGNADSALKEKLGIRLKYFKPAYLYRGLGTLSYIALLRYGLVQCAKVFVNSSLLFD